MLPTVDISTVSAASFNASLTYLTIFSSRWSVLQSPVGGLKGLALIPVWDGNVMAAVDGLRAAILGREGHDMACFHCWRS